ncbi:MAG TPA: hypothetical protein OIM63_00245 [Bacilli bacterium]|jgi:hypothetical protein|nr:hypothetical protein [Bacilli bacterium]
MAIKTLEDFNYDYQAYADYLESAECANDDGYSIYGDQYGNVYEAIDGDWTKGHSHVNENSNWEGRGLDDPKSKGRPWKNKWLKYAEKLNLTSEEVEFLTALYDYKQNDQVNGLEGDSSLSKRR